MRYLKRSTVVAFGGQLYLLDFSIDFEAKFVFEIFHRVLSMFSFYNEENTISNAPIKDILNLVSLLNFNFLLSAIKKYSFYENLLC